MADPTSPTLISPLNEAKVIGNVLEFHFNVPTDTDNDKLVFMVEMDTNSVINTESANYKKWESRLSTDNKVQGTWTVKNGSTWETLPTGGVGSAYYSFEAKTIIVKQQVSSYPNTNTIWYFRVKCSDAALLNPVYNQVIAAQTIYG